MSPTNRPIYRVLCRQHRPSPITVGGRVRCLDKRVISPLEKCLTFSWSTAQVSSPAVRTNSPCVSSERAPTPYLNRIYFRQPTPEPITAIPLEPTTFIWILRGITQHTGIVVICTPSTSTGWSPTVLTPYIQRLSRFNPKKITSHRPPKDNSISRR